MIKLLTVLNRFSLSTQIAKSAPPIMRHETSSGKDKYRNYHKSGPELFITKILMINGPLTSKQIWKIYEKKLHECKVKKIEPDFQYWPSLTKLKLTIKFMRINNKIKSNGYSMKRHHFSGWQIQEKRALKYAHPTAIHQIKQQIAKRDEL